MPVQSRKEWDWNVLNSKIAQTSVVSRQTDFRIFVQESLKGWRSIQSSCICDIIYFCKISDTRAALFWIDEEKSIRIILKNRPHTSIHVPMSWKLNGVVVAALAFSCFIDLHQRAHKQMLNLKIVVRFVSPNKWNKYESCTWCSKRPTFLAKKRRTAHCNEISVIKQASHCWSSYSRRWPRSRSHDSHLPLNASDSSLRWGGEYIERKSGGMKNIREFWDRAANSRCCAGLVIFNQMMPSHQLPFLPNTLKDYNRVCWYQRKKKSNLTCRTRLNSLKLAIKNSDGHLSHDRVSLSVSRQNSTRL